MLGSLLQVWEQPLPRWRIHRCRSSPDWTVARVPVGAGAAGAAAGHVETFHQGVATAIFRFAFVDVVATHPVFVEGVLLVADAMHAAGQVFALILAFGRGGQGALIDVVAGKAVAVQHPPVFALAIKGAGHVHAGLVAVVGFVNAFVNVVATAIELVHQKTIFARVADHHACVHARIERQNGRRRFAQLAGATAQ